MPLSDIADQTCSVARALSVVGDAWTLMVVRELFLGSRRFDEFQTYTGASPHLLSQRLRALEASGVVERSAYQQRPLRHEYRLTEKGVSLWPLIVALREWGDRWEGAHRRETPPVRMTHRDCQGSIRARHVCEVCAAEVPPQEVKVVMSRAAVSARRAARAERKAPRRVRPAKR
jgi:DNA-binding HxlR family transcriptional regulator